MKSLLTLHISVLLDVGRLCSVVTDKDASRILARWEHEGDSFLMITLPTFGKALEKGLATGRWPRHDVMGFAHHRGLPAFLRGFLTLVFHPSGELLANPDPEAVYAIRQLCYLTHKVERPTSPKRTQAAFDQYRDTERELANVDWDYDSPYPRNIRLMFARLFGGLLNDLDQKIRNFELVPKHGPGSTADGLSPAEKWTFPNWSERLSDVFPSWRYTQNILRGWDCADVPVEKEMPVKVITVPKTAKTPRIIAMEPASVQYAQQAMKQEIYAYVKRSSLHSLIGFTDQHRNQELARIASISGDLATLDLSEASDRVSWRLVQELFAPWPNVLDMLDATRSRSALVQGEILPLTKFASMGSALTFPIEAMVFLTIVAYRVLESDGTLTRTDKLVGRVSVYGDDIVVPSALAADVALDLEFFGFKVNSGKSFWTGLFRESCGKDWYAGTDVSVTRLRHDFPQSRQDAALIAQLTDFRNRAYQAGLWATVKLVDAHLDRVHKPHFVSLKRGSASSLGIIARDTVLPISWDAKVYYDPNYQIWKRRYPRLRPHAKAWSVDGEPGLLKWFQESIHKDVDLDDEYQRQERPHAFSISMGGIEWLPNRSMGREACEMG